MGIKSYDCDGVINLDEFGVLFTPGSINDVIITGRSIDEKKETLDWLHDHGIYNVVYFNPIKFHEKTRESSGIHKANTINMLRSRGINIEFHIDDDKIQIETMKKFLHNKIKIVYVDHGNIIEMENIKRD